eukprot:228975_1
MTRFVYPYELGYDAYVQELSQRPHSHDPTWSNYKSCKEWGIRRLVYLQENVTGKVRSAWNLLGKQCPLHSLTFAKIGQVTSILYDKRSKYKPTGPTTQLEAVESLKDLTKISSHNHWGRIRLKCQQMKNDEDIMELVVLNNVEQIQDKLEIIEKELQMKHKQQQYLQNKLTTLTSPFWIYSSLLWNASPSGHILIIGTFHGALRVITPLSTYFSKGTISMIHMRDGTWVTPSMSPTSEVLKPWQQLQQLGPLIEAHNINYRSKFYNGLFALMSSKEYEDYKMMDQLIEEGFRKRGYQNVKAIVNKRIEQVKKDHPFKCNEYEMIQIVVDDGDAQMQNDEQEIKVDVNDVQMIEKDEQQIKSDVNDDEDLDFENDERIYVPDGVHVDFEQGPIKALKDISTILLILTCFFHFWQAIVRYIGSTGLKTAYIANTPFRIAIILLVLCAFLPLQQILPQVEIQLRMVLAAAPVGKLLATKKVVNYFRKTWLKRYKPVLWCMFLRINRTTGLLERNNKEIKGGIASTAYWLDYLDHIVEVDANETIGYERLLKHGKKVFDLKRPKQRERESALWKCMQQYDQSGRKDPGKFLLEMAALYANRTKDNQEILAILDEYDENNENNVVIDQHFERVAGVCYITDSLPLQELRNNIFDEKICDAVYQYICCTDEWVGKIKKRKTIPKNIHSTLSFYNGNVASLANSVIAIKFGRFWVGSFVAMVEGDAVLIYTNDKSEKYQIILDMNRSIKQNHVKLL